MKHKKKNKQSDNKSKYLIYVIIVLSIILLYKRLKSSTIPPIPKYVLYFDLNGMWIEIPEDLKNIIDYFGNNPNYQSYQVCLVGEKESVAKDLKNDYQDDYPFIHLDKSSLRSVNFPENIIDSIERVNALVSSPENNFNQTNLGFHTLGLVQTDELPDLIDKNYGLTSWNSIRIFSQCCSLKDCCSHPYCTCCSNCCIQNTNCSQSTNKSPTNNHWKPKFHSYRG